ncbi:hypothetical protein Gohar_022369 [Gossypium harknessii]|uniref:Uncharacterized protein n=1 Tax=Gossypium harknessii TaxID=34285 RepID=A0A7J9IFQ2_9ROSI|nr:hypothetical protein [Gossypium harknessii]
MGGWAFEKVRLWKDDLPDEGENFHKERIEEADDINLLEGDVTIDVVDEIPIDRVQSLVKKRMLRCSSSSYLAEGLGLIHIGMMAL